MSKNEVLLERLKSGDDTIDELVESNMGLVYKIAGRFLGRGVEADDLYQIGTLGLIKAIKRFDLSFGACFSTYAVPMIMGEIKRFLRDDGIIKVSRSVKKKAREVINAKNELSIELGREPKLSEISQRLGVEAAELAAGFEASQALESLDDENGMMDYASSLKDFGFEEKLVENLSLRDAIMKMKNLK